MTSQRPSLIRLSSIFMHPPFAPPTSAPSRKPRAPPPLLQIPLPIRPPFAPPTKTQDPGLPSPPTDASLPPETPHSTLPLEPPVSPTALTEAPPRSPVSTASPPRSPASTPPPTPTTLSNYNSAVETFSTSTNTPASFNSVPTSPRTETEASMPNSPIIKHITVASPIMKLLSHPPSSLTLLPTQITEDDDEHEPMMIEQKSVLVHETVDMPLEMLNTHNNGIASDESTKQDMGTEKKLSDSQELGTSVMTLAGNKNNGAMMMELSHSHKKNQPAGNPGSQNMTKTTHPRSSSGDQSGKDDISEDEGSKSKDKTKRAMTIQSSPVSVYLNNNVQGVNNSILSKCICKLDDPGVHISLRTKV